MEWVRAALAAYTRPRAADFCCSQGRVVAGFARGSRF